MKIKEAKNILELIRDNIETPIPEITRTGSIIVVSLFKPSSPNRD